MRPSRPAGSRTGSFLARLLPVALALSGCGGKLESWEGEPPPNVLYVTVDTLRADALGSYGYGKPTSPRLDEFAATATVFEQAMSSASWTLPSFASLFTSYFPTTHGVWKSTSRLDESFVTMAELFNRSGYDTACFVSHWMLTSNSGLQQGFVNFDDDFNDPDADVANRVSSEEIAREGIRFLEQKVASADGVPWLLWLHFFDPHETYVEHPGITERFRKNQLDMRGTYDGEVRFTDESIGRVLQRLGELGLAEHTVVVFVSDHGEEFRDHGGLAHGGHLFNELVRVPLMIRVPGTTPRRVRQVVRTVDVLPTLLDLAGIRPGFEIEGASLLPLIRGQDTLSLAPAVLEIGQNDDTTMKGIVKDRWKLVQRLAPDGSQEPSALYDLEADPAEKTDVAAAHPEVVAELERLLRHMIGQARTFGSMYDHGEDLDLSPAQLEALKGLGYLGDE